MKRVTEVVVLGDQAREMQIRSNNVARNPRTNPVSNEVDALRLGQLGKFYVEYGGHNGGKVTQINSASDVTGAQSSTLTRGTGISQTPRQATQAT